MHFASFMDFTGELKNTLSGGGLAGVNMGEDADISVLG